jgi:hypothetical protein
MNSQAFPQQVGLLGYSDPPHLPSHHRLGESDSFQPVRLAFLFLGLFFYSSGTHRVAYDGTLTCCIVLFLGFIFPVISHNDDLNKKNGH